MRTKRGMFSELARSLLFPDDLKKLFAGFSDVGSLEGFRNVLDFLA